MCIYRYTYIYIVCTCICICICMYCRYIYIIMSSTCLFYTDIPLYSLICVCRRHPCFIFTLKSSAIHVHYPTMLPGPVQSYHTPIWCGTWEKLERNGVDKRENSWKSARLGSNHLKRGLDFFINNGDQPTKIWLWLDCITLILIYG
jgi:hypothetical protein